MKFSRITAFLTLFAIFFISPLHSAAASTLVEEAIQQATHMPMATPKNPPKAAEAPSLTSESYGDDSDAFGPDLTGIGALRLGTRYKSFMEVLKAADKTEFGIYELNNYQYLMCMEKLLKPPFFKYEYSDTYYKLKGIASSVVGKHREEAEQKKRTPQQHLEACLSYGPLLIVAFSRNANGDIIDAPVFQFFCDSKDNFRLCYVSAKVEFSYRSELALFIVENFGKKYGIEDMYEAGQTGSYYWKDVNRKFVLTVPRNNKVVLRPIASENTLYPYFDDYVGQMSFYYAGISDLDRAMGFRGYTTFENFK